MSRIWNGKAFIDSMAKRVWDESISFRPKIIEMVNEIQNELAGEIPSYFYLFKLKKLIATEEEIIDLDPQIPVQPTAAISQDPTVKNYNTSTESDYTKSAARDINFQLTNTILGPGLVTDENLRALYTTGVNATAALVNATGVLNGAATVSGGVLNLPVSDNNYAAYDGENTTWASEGCIRFKFTPNYSGAPASTNYMFTYANGENDIDNFIRIMQTGTNIRWDVYNSTGTVIKTVQTGNIFNPTALQKYEFEFNFNVAAGEYRLFIDGVLINGLQTSAAGTRTDDLGAIIRVGKNYTASVDSGSNGKMDDVRLFNAVQHTANYTPAPAPLYSLDVPKITMNAAFPAGELDSFAESAIKPVNTEVKYTIVINAVESYYDGAAWVASNGTYSEANTAAEISPVMVDIFASPGTIKVNAFLFSSDDQATPELASITVTDIGQLVDGTEYEAYVSFLLFSEDDRNYIESEPSVASVSVAADFNNQSLTLSNISTYDGLSTVKPNNIHRRIYLATKASGETVFTEPFFCCDIEDNVTVSRIVSTEPSSTITPPSDSEVSQISERAPRFNSANRILTRVNQAKVKRYDPDSTNTTTSPSFYDYYGPRRIFISPRLSSGATEAQRTITYEVYRRPHEIFYDITRKLDLPIEAEPALRRGVEYLVYDYKDRDGKVSKFNQYEAEKKKFKERMRRQRNRPTTVTDVTGDVFGFEV